MEAVPPELRGRNAVAVNVPSRGGWESSRRRLSALRAGGVRDGYECELAGPVTLMCFFVEWKTLLPVASS